jgi:hemerythrin-like domain-containing protein
MTFANPVSRTLHEEHRATVALMERLEQLLARHRKGAPSGDAALTQLLADLAAGVAAEVQRHFAFEEEHLFTYLKANGDEAIGEHLTEEHSAIRPLGVAVAELAAAAAARGFDQRSWEEFRRLGQELCERMLAHVQKEEMALLPLLDESMDGDTASRLLQEYLESA